MPATLFEHRVGGMFDELKVTLPLRAPDHSGTNTPG
jgi:hypothetical protein